MGIKKISGVVLKKNKNYLKILTDDRNEGYDILIRSGVAKNLIEDERFSLYVTSISMKIEHGIKIYTYSNSTYEKDGKNIYQLNFDFNELKLLFYMLNNNYEKISQNYNGDYDTKEQIILLENILNKISQKIYK